jgi:hypothetical protein
VPLVLDSMPGMIEKRLAIAPVITANHTTLTAAWTADVKALATALGRITDARVSGDCRVTFFEVAGDPQLHVNVTRRSAGKGVNGWAGPGAMSDGVVYNRTFSRMPRYQMLRQIKEMIFAAPS